MGYPSPTRSIGIKTLAGFLCQSIERKRLRDKVLIALDLGPLPLLLWAPGWAVLVPPGAGPPFRPDQKVKLDKTEAGRGGLFLRHGFLVLKLELASRTGRDVRIEESWLMFGPNRWLVGRSSTASDWREISRALVLILSGEKTVPKTPSG